MNNIKQWSLKHKNALLFILIAYIFSVTIRFIWVYHFHEVESFQYNNQLMVNTNDSYYFAKGAQDIIEGVAKDERYKGASTTLAITTATLAKVLPFISFETLILYMPSFLSSLVVVPLILIGYSLNNLRLGFIAALIGSIAMSYYNRTMVGYYDTDMLNIVLPTILLWSLIGAVRSNKNIYLLIIALDALVYRWWYPQSYALEFAFVSLIFAFVVYKWIKKEDITYYLKLLSLMLLAVVMAHEWLRLVGIFVLFYLFNKKEFDKFVPYILAAVFVVFYLLGGLDPIIAQLQNYVFRQEVALDDRGLGLQFFTVMQTVREASAIPFGLFADRISGHIVTFVLAMIGYVWLCIKYPVMLLALPMLGLGFLAYGIPGVVNSGGLRFTIYAVPIAALGFAFFVMQITSYFRHEALRMIALVGLVALALLPNIAHVNNYKVPTVFNANEVEVLVQLEKIAQKDDYTIAWWDYGYPIAYYADTQTLIDGGKHRGDVNFPVSFTLTNPQTQAAKMARLSVEYEKMAQLQSEENRTLASEQRVPILSNIEQMTLDYGYDDTNNFLRDLSFLETPEPTSDIYLYLPLRMSSIYPTILNFSNMDLMSGERFNAPFFYESHFVQSQGEMIDFGNGVVLNRSNSMLQIGQNQIPVTRFIQTVYDSNGLNVNTQNLRDEGLTIMLLQSYNKVLIMDETIYNSLYIQLFFLDNYDENLFKKVIDSPLAKVYKLKI